MKNQKGFTLIELLVAAGLLAVVTAGLFLAFQSGMAALQKSEDYLSKERDQEVFLIQLSQELRNAVPYAIFPFFGKSDNLRFTTRLSRYTPKGVEEGLFLIEYQVKNGAVIRKESKLKKENIKEPFHSTEVFLDGSNCRFDYLELKPGGAMTWQAQWINKPYTGLPRGVRVQMRGASLGAENNSQQILIPQGFLEKRL